MKKNIKIIMIILLFTFILSACSINFSLPDINIKESSETSDLLIYFIDVGQADCTLIELPNGEEVLIDTGNTDDADLVIDTINSLNIDKIEYLILTHPHEDHMGSASDIIKEIEIEKIYIPDIESDAKFYEDAKKVIKSQNIPIIKATAGLTIIDIPDLTFKVLAPNSMYYSEMNEYSIVSRLEYKNTSFLFTGDAESVSELEMVNKGYYLKSDLLHVGHHGGRTSSSKKFLDSVNPKYSIISVGKDNIYGHPHEETLKRLKAVGTEIYKINELGTIIATSDGNKISIISDQLSINDSSATNQKVQFIGNKNTRKFHIPNCSSVKTIKEANRVSFTKRENAVNQGYEPCGSCKP
ncbi:MAG: ComEC/Rec2 family competence protein [Tissierellia bacterium]|nr:ComEC/Rec2 family competence protein [Tissierellia bacterium]MDD4779490.1 ComEC/Rec2 family competence protein [Tissierellia bacterium]